MIMHADLDAFYASVEQMLDPSLKGRPVLVGNGVVVAASYEARAYGVRAPMPTRDALDMCPRAVVVDGHFSLYLEMSSQVMAIFEDATPVVEQISVDEAFLDVSGTAHILGPPSAIARAIRRRVRSEVGLPLSVGVASTKFLAKIASARAKPDGLVVVPVGSELDFLHPLPVEALWGVGRVTALKLHRLGVQTIGELAELSQDSLSPLLGRASSLALRSLAWNHDPRPVQGGRRSGSVGSQQALGRGLDDREAMRSVVKGLADRVGRRLRSKGRSGYTLTVRARFPGPKLATRSHTLPSPTSSTAALAALGDDLLERALAANGERVTLIGLSVSNLTDTGSVQLELELDGGHALRSGSTADQSGRRIDERVDEVRRRFGSGSLRYGDGPGGPGDDFRRLAEKD